MSSSRRSVGPTRAPSSSQQRKDPLFRGSGCHLCRARKVKCNAGKPFCDRCLAQGNTEKCIYDPVKKSKYTLAKEEIMVLKEQIASMERQLAGRSEPTTPVPGPSSLDDEEDVKTPPSGFLGGLQLVDSEEELEPSPIGEQDYPDQPAPYPVQTGVQYPGPSSVVPPPAFETGPFQPQENYHQSSFDYRYGGPQAGVSPSIPTSWSMASATMAASSSTGSILPQSQSGQNWEPMPYLHPNETPASPGGMPFGSQAGYGQGVAFGNHGTYRGGPIPSYDAYQGAPSRRIPFIVRDRERPMPSPPVFGVDLVMNFFRTWKLESQSRYPSLSNYGHATGINEHYSGSGWELVGNWWEKDDLPVDLRDELLELFRPFRKQVGLEIWVPDFLASLHNPPHGRPHPGLMWMMYTFAATFSGDPKLEELVPDFFKKARSNLAQSLADNDRLFNYVQGMTLCASMLYMTGKITQGHMEANAACHAAILCGLHKISSPNWTRNDQPPPPRSGLKIRQIDFELAPAQSPREHGERIAAFWQLVLVDHSAAAATGLPAMFRDDGDERSRVETVFPRPLEEYLDNKAADAPYATLRDVFEPRFIPRDPPDTIMTLQVKSTALLERAVRLGTMWRDGQDVSLTNPTKYQAEYQTVLHGIQHFRHYLPPSWSDEPGPLPRTSGGLVWDRLYAHFMTLNAQIELYHVIAGTNQEAYDNCLYSARLVVQMVRQLTNDEISRLGVMLGHCFNLATHVLMRELKARKAHGDEAGIAYVNQELDVILQALSVLGKEHHLVGVQSLRANRARMHENELPASVQY
ncbi:hypothetical protein BDV93DRAFT_602093 [Ceratobasidium sp. AG-I]|nr:hypothetical protein BDV93DRAFT_602093 [Ceratobasidium sp. AG-I]